MAEETGLPTDEAMDIIARGARLSFLSEPLTCERIEKARHFIFDEMMVHYREWGYAVLTSAVDSYVNRFHSNQQTTAEAEKAILDAYRRKGMMV